MPTGPLNFRGNMHLIWECYSDPFTEWPEKLSALSKSQKRVGPATGQAAMQAVLLIGPHDSEDMIVLGVLVVQRDAVCSLWQASPYR